METVARNAKQAFALHKIKRASDLTARSLALAEMQEALDLREAPLRIECFDVSHLQGTDVVASMVVFEDGLARKSEYRRFAVQRRATGQDDVAPSTRSITPPLPPLPRGASDDRRAGQRRRHRDDGGDGQLDRRPGPDRPRDRPAAQVRLPAATCSSSTAAPPQVAAARRALAELGIDDVALCGLAKRLEEVWLPGEDDPVILPRTSRGAVPAAAGPRRGAPVRDHLPPAEAVHGR